MSSTPNNSASVELQARWIVHSLDWGVLSTISSRLYGKRQQDGIVIDGEGSVSASPVPFGNIYSFVDGPCDNATGVVYIYGTYMDQSFIDSVENNIVSFSLSEASLPSVCADHLGVPACMIGTKYGDPENPVCARLTLTGELVVLDASTPEYDFAEQALFQRHSTMEGWPSDHGWIIGKVVLHDVWLIDYFGGASIISPEDYFAASVSGREYDQN